tara:strand:- start:408 stop:881 length:474 start_codon:yes stop_codon:yes gene_type:complete
MKKNNKSCLLIIFVILSTFSFFAKLYGSESANFLSLKNNEVNLRQGPSFEHPVKLIYKKKYLPILILDKSETWRKIKDFENNSGWIHISQLSKKKSALNIEKNSLLYKKPTIYSKPMARLDSGRLVLVKKCNLEWCKITSGKYSGWIKKKYLWGKIK